MSQQFSGAAAIRAAMMIMGSTYVTYALGLLTSVFIARSLGPESFGRYTYVVWIAGLLIAFGNNGITTTTIRFVSESLGRGSVESARSVHGWLLRRQLACLALVAVVFIACAPWFKPAGWEKNLIGFVAIALCAAMAKAMFLFDVSVAKGYGRFGVEAKSTVLMSVINIVAVLGLLALDAPVMAYMVLFTLVSISYAICAAVMLHRGGVFPSRASIEPDLLVRLRRHLFWTILLTVTYAFSNKSVETYLLNSLVGAKAVGYFAIAAALTRGGIDLLSSGLTTVLMPMMAHAFGDGGKKSANIIMANSIRYFMFMGLLLAGAGVLVAGPAVTLMYGHAYAPVIMPLRVMIVVGGLTLTEGAFNALLSTTDNQPFRVVFSVMSAVITAAFAIFLIPKFGLAGAVISHATSRITMVTLMAIGITRVMQLTLPWRELIRSFVGAALAALVVAAPLLAWPGIWVQLVCSVVYVIVFLASSVALKVWRASDILHVISFLERYPYLYVRSQGILHRWAARSP